MDAVDFIFGVKRDDSEFLHRFGFEVKNGLEGIKAGQRTGYPAAFEVIPAAFGADLFEGVDIDIGEGHKNNSPDINFLFSLHLVTHYL